MWLIWQLLCVTLWFNLYHNIQILNSFPVWTQISGKIEVPTNEQNLLCTWSYRTYETWNCIEGVSYFYTKYASNHFCLRVLNLPVRFSSFVGFVIYYWSFFPKSIVICTIHLEIKMKKSTGIFHSPFTPSLIHFLKQNLVNYLHPSNRISQNRKKVRRCGRGQGMILIGKLAIHIQFHFTRCISISPIGSWLICQWCQTWVCAHFGVKLDYELHFMKKMVHQTNI